MRSNKPQQQQQAVQQQDKMQATRALALHRYASILCVGQPVKWRALSVRYLSNEDFKTIPINPSILTYIENIGVGISKRRVVKKKKKKKKKKRGPSGGVLTKEEERAFFQQTKQTSSSYRPPPPFAAPPSSDEVNIKRRPIKILGSVGTPDDEFPAGNKDIAEIALAGRSNVGKSTLLNALLYGNHTNKPISKTNTGETSRGRRIPEGTKLPKGKKAVVSSTPGETKRITFYQLSSTIKMPDSTRMETLSLWLVDLPGYGFAYAKEEQAEMWKKLMQSYLINRGKSLKRVLLLIDARHGMKKADLDFLTSLEAIMHSSSERKDLPPIQLVLTKCDLVKQADLARRVVQVRQQLLGMLRREPSSLPVMLVSAKAGVGFNNMDGNRALGGVLELQREIAALAPNHVMSLVSDQGAVDKK